MSGATERADEISVFDPTCISREVLAHATGRWGGLTLAALSGGPLRFSQVGRAVSGITDRMLSQTLQRLEHDGLVARTESASAPGDPSAPPKMVYALTDMGQPIADRVNDLIQAIYEQIPAIVTHQRRQEE